MNLPGVWTKVTEFPARVPGHPQASVDRKPDRDVLAHLGRYCYLARNVRKYVRITKYGDAKAC